MEPSTFASRHWRLVVTVAAGLGVALATLILSPHSPGAVGTTTPAIVYLLIVLAAALAGGRVPGLVIAALALLAQVYYFVPPDHGFSVQDSRSAISLIVFALAELTVCFVGASQRQARLRAELAGARAARLQRFTSSLSRALTAQAVYDVALGEGRELLGANAGIVALPTADGSAVEMVATFGFSEEEIGSWRRFPLTQRTPIGEAIELGRSVFLAEGQRESLYPESGGRGAPTASVPLRVGESTLGALGFRFERGHTFDGSARQFAVTMGEQCANALERARVYDAERRGREALGLLASIGEQLARSLEPGVALRTLADLVVPTLADQCIVDTVIGDEVQRLVVVNADPGVHEAALVLERYPPVLSSETPVAVAIRTGEPQLVASTVDLPDGAYRNTEHRIAVGRVGIRTMLSMPLLVRGRTLGALTFGWQSTTLPGEDRQQLAAQIARRVALALDNSALYQEAHGERERLAALVRQLPLGVIIAESSSRKLLFTNQRAQEMLGHGASERSIAGPHAEFVHRALEGDSTSGSEIEVIRADGSHGIVSLSAEPVRDAGGEIVAAVATLFDLTEHRQREEALAFLAEASVVLTETLDLQHTLAELVELAVPRLADWCTIDMVERGEIRNVGVAHSNPESARLARRVQERRPLRAQASSGVSAALSTGRSQLIRDVPSWLAAQETPDEELLTLSRLLDVRSSIVAPLAGRGRVFGALTLATAESGRVFTEEDLAVAEDLARRASLAIDNARLYGAEHDIAHALQQSLLPGTLTQPPGAEIAARYRPAGEGAEVGGDFYDTWQHEGIYFLAIGDVAGHGPAAAALTSLTRQAMRVVSRYESSPARILAVVNETIRAQTAPEQFCTAALATLRPASDGQLLTVACAGHPPPVVVRAATGEPEEVGVCGALLGVVADRSYSDRECLLGLGDLVAFWTDGVTERRHAGDMFGEQRLLSLLAGAGRRPAAEVACEIDDAVVSFAPGLPHDDVAILVARVTAVARVHGDFAGRPQTLQST
ncbi:MAG TPA: SpoIIE family protein phosphatase [Gaiellales bacterium]|nr:SpoIIE family protein phosphatase [Gaiellales bacterium]